MAMKWSDVAANPAFQALSFDEQEEARNQYFNEVVAPRVPKDEVDAVRSEFIADTQTTLAPPPDTGDETARLAARYKAPEKPGLIARMSSALPKPVDPLGIASGKPLGAPRPQEPVKATKEPTPYRDRREALDDAVNLLEEGADQKAVTEAFSKGGIKFEEIVAHGKKRGSEYFEQQPGMEIADPEVTRLANRYPAPVTGEIKSTRPETPLPGADVLLAGAKGVVGGFKMLMSAGGAGGRPTSTAEKALETADSYLEGLRSAAAVKDDERIGQIMEEAKDGTWTEQVVAAAKAAGVAPASLVAQGLGTSVPVILASLLPGVRESTVARLTAQIGLGAAQGAGATKESIYTAVKEDMLRAGVSKIEAEERAEAAQSYLGQNKDQIAIGMALGALASSTGVEKVIPIGQVSKVLAKSGVSRAVASAEQNVIGRGLIGGLTEAVPEFAQGSAEQVAQNVALQREGRDVPTFQGAVGQGTLEAIAGFGAGAVTSAAFGRPQTAADQLARELDVSIANTDFTSADPVARARLDVNRYDPTLISPEQTARGVADVGPSDPISFTPVGAPTQQAGLVDIVVPTAPETTDVSTLGATGGQLDLRSPAGGDQLGGGVDLPRLDVDGTGQLRRGDAGLPAADAGANVPAGGTAGQPTPGIALPRVAARATDQDLLARTEAAIAAPENNNAVVQPVEQWVGRKGDGYVTEADATQALPGRQRMFPALEWTVEQMPSGKFRLAGYEQQITQPAPTVGTTEAGAGTPQPTQAAPITAAAPQAVEPITAPSGEPFATTQTATVFARQNGITDFTTQPVDGGFVIQPATVTAPEVEAAPAAPVAPTPAAAEPITAPSGKPFSTEKTAAVYAQQNGITGYSTVKMGGGWVIKPTETTLGNQTPQAIQGQAQGQAPAIGGAASQRLAGGPQPGDAAQASVSEVAGAAAPGVADNARQLASAQPELGQPLTASASEGERAAVLGGPLFSSKVKSAPISVIKLAQDYITRQSGVEFAPVSSNNLSEQQRAASLIATLNGQTVTFIEQTAGDQNAMPNGLAVGGKHVMIDVKSEDAPLAVAMHEVVHNMPDNIRKPLEGALRNLFKSGMEGDFKREFNYDDADLDEEIPAMITQAVTKRKDFWNELRQEMGNKDFSAVAELIITRLDNWVRGVRNEYGDGFVSKYVTDVEQARSLIAKAYAQSMREQGLQPNEALASDISSSRRVKTEKVGDFDMAMAKDGSITVFGDSDAIRAQIPENVQGRVTKDGITFTNAAAPRVRAALEGRQVAYSRGGEVTEKLPMKNGKYLGAPEKFNTPGKIPTLRKILRQLADEGAPGRYWYENSGKEVLKMVGGDVNEARKFVALLAIYSPQAKVDANSTFALRAWAQYKAGQPISVKTQVMDDKAKAALDDVDAFWSGEKTGNFFFNLLREIDPTTAGKQGATIDMWMMRAGQYDTDAPTGTQYSFMENETNRLAQELGWEPQQVQAAIWVAMKARMENSGVKKTTEKTSEKKGWIKFVPGKEGKGKVRVILDAQKHRDNWLKYSFEHDVTKDDTQQAKFDFGDGLKRHIGQVSFEARPGRTTNVLPGIHSAPYAQQMEFQQAVQAAFLDENGADTLAQMLGLLVDTSDMLAPNVWRGEVSPSTQKLVAMAPSKGDAGKTSVDPAQAQALNLYAAVAGLVARQDGVGWHRPFYSSTKRDANGLDINLGRVINPAEMADVQRAVAAWMNDNNVKDWQDKFGFTASPSGIRLVNFGIITNEKLQTDILRVAESVLPDFDYRVFASSGEIATNNWKESPNGESYVQGIGAAGRSDVLDWARAVLAPRVQQVFDEYSKQYGWGDAGTIRFSNRAGDGSRGQGAGSAQDRQVQAPERADAQTVQGLSATDALPGAPTVQGFTGPDPRLVAVAEQYARDNGITLRRQAEYAQVDPERAARIAAAYEAMPHAPQDLRVKAAYKELIAQTLAQYRALEKAGYKFWFIDSKKPDNAEYASSPWNAMRDIRANKVMGVFPTDDGFGSGDFDPASNPLLEDTGIKWPSGSLFGPRKRVLANDLFRAVHDAFGHGLEGSGFRAQGEENAWQAHVRLFTGAAVAAITTETRGQNSWLNYGPNGESNRNAKVEDTVFADQKTGLLPEFAWTEGRVGDMPEVMASNRAKPTFYSQLERVIANVPAKLATQPATQWALWLDSNAPKAGVKKDEVEWSGIKDYLTLRGKDKVTSAELQAYLADSGVKVSEVMRGEVDQDETYEQMARDMFDAEHYDLSPSQSRELRQAHDRMLTQSNTAYDKYQLPGGENYRELLITLPVADELPPIEQMQRRAEVLRELEADYRAEGLDELAKKTADKIAKVEQGIQKAMLQKQKNTYQSSHWSEKNVVAHIRINDRTDADGKRVLFVEEVQSDWGQDGLKKGFGAKLKNGYSIVEQEPGFFHLRQAGREYPIAVGTRANVEKEGQAKGAFESGLPAAPFVTKTEGWLNLALKRIAMLAVEEGYDKVAFVNGQQSADRYDLSKQISSISYEPGSKPENEGLLQAWDLDRKMVMSEMVTTDRIEDYVGKEVAVRLLETDKVMGKHLLDGENIKVGGKGMIKFYDQIVPQALNKLLPKLGGEKMGSVGIPLPMGNGEKTPAGAVQWVINVNGREYNGYSDEGVARQELAELLEDGKNAELIDARNPETSQQPGFDVTDKMRETVGAGLPMFSKRVAAPETTEFKKWFGDSKVVDAKGKPLVVYHGTIKSFDAFDADAEPFSYESDRGKQFFLDNPQGASDYAIGTSDAYGGNANVMPVYLRMENPRIEEVDGSPSEWWDENGDGLFWKLDVEESGHDGLIVRGNGETMYVTANPKQIKSATGNDGNFDATNPDIRRSNRRQKLSTIGQNFTLPATGVVDSGRIKLQDDALRMKRVIEAVEKKTGTKVGEAQNFYDANTLMPGRIQATMDDFRDNVMRPLINKAVDFGIDLDELALYAYAKHAKERNAYIASINKRFPDGGSGMTNDHADSILQLAKVSGDEAKFEELHRDLMAITSTTRQVMLAEGLISQDEFNALDGAYDNYIPLRGLENVDEKTGAIRPGVGRGINVRGGETIKALGRKSQASDLIENVIRDYQRVIMRVEKNDVGKVLLDFVLSNPDPDLWGVDVERSKPSLNKATGLVQYTKNIEKGEDTIGVKVGGQQVYIKLADPELARAIRQAWKDEVSGLERVTLAVSGWWNNWLRNVFTRYNPAFAVLNIPKDALWSGTTAALAELGPKGLARYLANYGKAFMASARKEAGVSGTTNKFFGNQSQDQVFQEFRNAGAITGGFYMRSLDEINNDLRNDMLMAGAKASNTFEAIKSLPPYKLATLTARMLEFMGAASENATRFALYQAAKDVGRTPAQAALLAKDGTTNFNRKGEWGGALNNMYLFFNAAVQGTAQLAKVMKSPAVQASMAGVTGVGMMLALYGASAGGEDDDGEAYWDKIPSYVKERNLVFMLPPGEPLMDGIERVGKRGRYFTLPVQYGFNVFPNAGYMMADVFRNSQDPKRGLTPTKAALHMASVFFGSVNPLGGAIDFGDKNSVWLAALPTIADLPYQISEGIDSFGRPSSPEKASWDMRPDSSRMFTSQINTVPEKIAKALNELGGGNEAKAGKILGIETSVAPGTIKTLIGSTTGGLGTFAEQVGSSIVAATSDEKDLKAAKVPFLNKFYGEVDESANIGSASDRMRKVRDSVKELEAQFKLGLSPEIGSEEKRMMMLAEASKDYQKAISEMRKDEIEITKSDMPEAQKKLLNQQIRVQRDKLATIVNRVYLKSLEEQK